MSCLQPAAAAVNEARRRRRDIRPRGWCRKRRASLRCRRGSPRYREGPQRRRRTTRRSRVFQGNRARRSRARRALPTGMQARGPSRDSSVHGSGLPRSCAGLGRGFAEPGPRCLETCIVESDGDGNRLDRAAAAVRISPNVGDAIVGRASRGGRFWGLTRASSSRQSNANDSHYQCVRANACSRPGPARSRAITPRRPGGTSEVRRPRPLHRPSPWR